MCVIIAGEQEPDTTKLFSIPVIVEGEIKSTLSLYVNNFDLSSGTELDSNLFPSMERLPTMSGTYYNAWGQLVGHPKTEISNYRLNNGSIMIVAYPIEKIIENPLIGLVDVSTDSMKQFRSEVQKFKPIARSMSRSFNYFSNSMSDKTLEVHEVGNYLISVAIDLHSLQTRLDWTKFTKPNDFDVRIKTLQNPKLFPPTYNWFYIVATTIKNIKDDGFGVVHPRLTGDLIFFPTAHEQRNNSTSNSYNFDYDLYCYSLRDKNEARLTLTNNNTRNTHLHNKIILNPLNKLKNLPFFDINKNQLKLNPDINIKYLSIIQQNGKGNNHNCFL